jgi:hypothetical protein
VTQAREAGEERFPLLQIMLGNSFLLSGVYLVVGLLMECLRRLHPTEAVIRTTIAMDRLPAGVLEVLGLMGPIREAYLHEEVSAGTLRLVFGATTVALIFTLALVVGFGMWGAMQLQQRRAGRVR